MSRVWMLVGLACYYLDRVLDVALRRRRGAFRNTGLDRTGRVLQEPQALQVWRYEPDVLFVNYPGDFGHSLWRSQELSLFDRYRSYLDRPRLDFGCGDGSFASVLFDCVDYGVDRDQAALSVASGYQIYRSLICCDGGALPIRRQSVRSIYSNSVLEHVDAVEQVLGELYDVLLPDGVLMFTVPVSQFAAHVAKYFGLRESTLMNQRFYHKNLHPPEWWVEVLQRHGYSVIALQHYQPDWFTFWYRVLNTRMFHFLHRHGLIGSQHYRSFAVSLVRHSMPQTSQGGNVFVIARR